RWPRDWSSDVCSSDLRRLFQDAHGLDGLELLARDQDIAQVTSLHELHDDVILPRRDVPVDREDLDDVAVPQGHAHLALAFEQIEDRKSVVEGKRETND